MIVLWRITERCNYACGFCAHDHRLEIPRREVDAGEALRIGSLLADHARATGEPVLLSWLGGEPLLWRPLFSVSETLRARGLRLSVTTNGSTLHRPQVRDRVVATLDELTVSLDALAARHDALRGRDGAWARAVGGLLALRRARDAHGSALKLRANVVLMRSTLPQFGALCAELARAGVDEITFNQLGGRDRPEFFPAERLRAEDFRAFRSQVTSLRCELAAQGVRLCAAPRYLDRLDASARGVAWPVEDCAPGEAYLFIDESGRVGPCSFTLADYGVALDDLHSTDDIAALPARFRQARAARPAAECGDCPSTRVFAKFAA